MAITKTPSQESVLTEPLTPHRAPVTNHRYAIAALHGPLLFVSLKSSCGPSGQCFIRLIRYLLSLRALCARATCDKNHKILGSVAESSTGYQTSSRRLREDATIRLSLIAGSAQHSSDWFN
jgi:hypothetical protein